MKPEAIKLLRDELGCTARELAGALGVEQATVLAWERGELFPTRRLVERMEELRRAGPSAVPRRARGGAADPMQLLADPELWSIVRKLLLHAPLRAEVARLARQYDDPAEP